MHNYLLEKKAEFENVLDFFKRDIANLRTGRANPSILDGVQIRAYGVMNPVNAVANISLADSHSITLTPWDKGVIKDIEKALIEADLGLGVVNEGDKVRLSVPAMTEETRRDTVKKLNEKMEKARISLRQAREEIRGEIDRAEDNKEMSEDDKFRIMKDLDELVGKKNEELKEIRDLKEKDIMEI
jgi:ribosome recycling factor